jgi:superfamily I DNA and RNA helicase
MFAPIPLQGGTVSEAFIRLLSSAGMTTLLLHPFAAAIFTAIPDLTFFSRWMKIVRRLIPNFYRMVTALLLRVNLLFIFAMWLISNNETKISPKT